jgi:beta-lactamase regulating signal transducer with metallopeptidase domain
MLFAMDSAIANYFAIQWLGYLLNVCLQGTLVLLAVYAVFLTIIKSHANKHLILWLAFASFLLLPFFSQLHSLLVTGDLTRSEEPQRILQAAAPSAQSGLLRLHVRYNDADESAPRHLDLRRLHWSFWLLGLWGIGVLIGLLHIGVGRVVLWRIRQKAKRGPHLPYQALVSTLARQLGIKRHVRLLESEVLRIPVTCGSLFPVIILPASNVFEDPSIAMPMVIVHELMHIKRWDCLTQFLSRIVCALFWFNPLVWVVLAQQKAAQEQACDAAVIQSGITPSEYARMLVNLVRRFQSKTPLAETALFTTPSLLEQRILYILNGQRHAQARFSRKLIALTTLLGLCCISLCHPVFSFNDADTNLTLLREALRKRQHYRYAEFPLFLKQKSKGLPIAWPVLDGKGTHRWGQGNVQPSSSATDQYPLAYWLDIYWSHALPVVASEDGEVIEVQKWNPHIHVKIAHHHQYYTIYNHLNAARLLVKIGQQVKKGEIIGYMGQCVENASQYKMRYIIQRDVLSMNPYVFLYLWGPRLYFTQV